MNLKDAFNEAMPVIRAFAPTVGTAIGGPFGAAAGYILPILAGMFGGQASDLKGLATRILQDPNASDKLADIEKDHGDWLCTLMESMSHLSSAEVNIKLEWKTP